MKKSFTINNNRTSEEIETFGEMVLATGLLQGCEIFYPEHEDEKRRDCYTDDVKKLFARFPNTEKLLHLPYSAKENVADESSRDDVLSRLKRAITYGTDLGIRKMTLHPGNALSLSNKDQAKQEAFHNIRELARFAFGLGVQLMLENLVSDTEMMVSIPEIIEFMEELQEYNIGFTLDFGHASIRGIDIPTIIHRTKGVLSHTHIHDNHGVRDDHLAPLQGNIDFKSAFEALEKIGYSQMYGLEVRFRDVEELIQNAKILDAIKGKTHHD